MGSDDPQAQAHRLSRLLAALFALCLYGVPLALLLAGAAFVMLYDPVFETLQSRGLAGAVPPYLDVPRRALLVAVVALYCAPLLVAAAYLQRLFSSFASNVIFTAANVTRLRAVGGWLVVAALTANGSQFLFLVISGHPGEDFHPTLLPLLYASVIFVIAHVLEEANRMAEDNAKFV